MPTYDYSCRSCEKIFETKHGFNDPPDPCPNCGGTELTQVFNEPPLAFIKGEPTTLGQLADRNTAKMGKYELDKNRHKQEQGNVNKNKPKEWWEKNGNATKKEIRKMSDKQKSNYILKGKK